MPSTRSSNKPKPQPLFKNKQWQQCYESWLSSVQECSGSLGSRNVYNNICRDFFCQNKNPDAYTRADVEQFVRRKIPSRDGAPARPASARTQNARLVTLSSFYHYAAQYDVPFRHGTRALLHDAAPTRGMKSIKPGRRRRALSEDELKRFFAAIPRDTIMGKRDYALFSCYFWTARRRAEIVRLRWGDIFEAPFVEHGQIRQGHMYRYTPKGHSREYFAAELPEPAWQALKDYLVAVNTWGEIRDDQPLFVRLDKAHKPWNPDQPLHANSVNVLFARYAKLAGLKSGDIRQICPHSIRYTRAQVQFREDGNIMEIKDLLGHENIATTQIYLQEDEQADTGAARLAAKFGQL